MPMPLESDKEHHVSLSFTSQSDLRKYLGVTTLKVSDTYALRDWIKMKNEVNMNPSGELSCNQKFNF